MSQEAYEKREPNLAEGGTLLYEEELVEPKSTHDGVKAYGIPAARFAEELGNNMVLNMIMLGFLSGTTGLFEPEAAKKAIAASVPSHFVDLNHRAFDKGYEYGKSVLARETEASEVKK